MAKRKEEVSNQKFFYVKGGGIIFVKSASPDKTTVFGHNCNSKFLKLKPYQAHQLEEVPVSEDEIRKAFQRKRFANVKKTQHIRRKIVGSLASI